jgi:hypothetical protein
MKGKLYTIRFRVENAARDFCDRWLRRRCCAKPKYMQGGFHFWRCSLPHGHDGPHRTCNYLWGIGPDGRSEYDPDNGVVDRLERHPVRTLRQAREFEGWHRRKEAERRAALA